MSYKMEYEMTPSIVKIAATTVQRTKRRVNLKGWIYASAIIALLMLLAFTDVFIPGDPEVTKTAMSEMIEDVKSGEQVVDAFAAFCHSILQGS